MNIVFEQMDENHSTSKHIHAKIKNGLSVPLQRQKPL